MSYSCVDSNTTYYDNNGEWNGHTCKECGTFIIKESPVNKKINTLSEKLDFLIDKLIEFEEELLNITDADK